jgi:hypothetical protein
MIPVWFRFGGSLEEFAAEPTIASESSHWQMQDSSGVYYLMFAFGLAASWAASVESTPLTGTFCGYIRKQGPIGQIWEISAAVPKCVSLPPRIGRTDFWTEAALDQ